MIPDKEQALAMPLVDLLKILSIYKV